MRTFLKPMTHAGLIASLCLGSLPLNAQIKAKTAAKPAAPAKTFVAPVKPVVSATAENVSNRLPRPFVEQMIRENIWQPEFEVPGTAANQDILDFLKGLSNAQVSLENLAETLVRNTETYRLKIRLVQYFEHSSAATLTSYRLTPSRFASLKSQILQKYTEMTASLIRMSDISDYGPILSEFQRRLRSKELLLVDLNPELRRRWQDEQYQARVHQYESFNLEEQKDGQYLVNGIYVESKKTLAIDLSRSVYENLVTFSHEIIHAADPDLVSYRAQLDQRFAQVVSKLAPLVPVSNASAFVRSLIQDTFLEMNRVDIVNSLSKLRDVRVEKLKAQVEKNTLEPFVKDPDFKGFMRDLIATTVENEYKAYTMSLALYRVLNGKYRILPPSLKREEFIQAHFNHPHSLQTTLSLSMNPFSREVRSHLSSMQQETTPELTMLVNQMKSLFEIHYLEQSKAMMAETSEKFKNLFAIIQNKTPTDDRESQAPVWTQPGKFDSLANPYQLIAAKVLSTAQVIRFKLNMETFIQKMRGLQEPLLGLRAGFIDLHDTNFGELKLIGIQPEENSIQSLPSSLADKCKKDLNAQPEEYLAYFQETRWSPKAEIVREGSAPIRSVISQQSVMSNLVRLNLLKAAVWLRIEMPQSQENFISIKAAQAKLYEGQYDKNEISSERAQELMKELTSYAKATEVTVDELHKIEHLMTAVSQMYYMALENKWQPVAEEFYRRLLSAKRFFENMGFSARLSMTDIEAQMKNDIARFRQQVRERFRSCGASDRMDFYNGPDLFQLGNFRFPLTALCYNRELYVFRQTCDYNTAASTMTPEGRPETRVFIGGRPIRLEPFESLGRSR